MTFEGACDRDVFEVYFREVLCTVMIKSQRVIMNYASLHKLITIKTLNATSNFGIH